MEIVVLVRSSSRDEPYSVELVDSSNGLNLYCDCPAGEWGKFCKHKTAVVVGDESFLYDEAQVEALEAARPLILNSKYPDLFEELTELEKQLESTKKAVKQHKDRIARLMKEGGR